MGESTTYRGTLGSGEAGGALGSIGSLGTENIQFEEAFFLLAAPSLFLHVALAAPRTFSLFNLALLSRLETRESEKRRSRC